MLGISFSTTVRAVVAAELVILGDSFLTSFILVLKEVLVATLVISGILSIFLILALYAFFITTSFLTTSLSLLKSGGTGTNLSTSN